MKRTSPTKCPSESLFTLRRCKFPCVQLQSVWKGFVMHTAVRPYATAGVALVGASVIAVTPLAPPLPDIHIAAPHVSAAVELTQFVNPITTLVGVITDTVGNLTTLGQQVLADPAPILQQVIINQIANAMTLATAAQSSVSALVNLLQGLPAVLQSAFSDLTMGNISGAIDSVFGYLVLGGLLGVGAPLLQGISTVGTAVGQNIGNAIAAFFSPTSLLNLAIAFVHPIFSTESAFSFTAQQLFNAVTTGDFVTAASVLINAPIVLTGAFLNGDPTGSPTTSGLLTTDFGTFANLLNVRDNIAAAIVPFTDPGGVVVKAKEPAPVGPPRSAQANQVPALVTSKAGQQANVSNTPALTVLVPAATKPTTTAPKVTADGNKAALSFTHPPTGGSHYVPKHAK